MPPQLEKFYSFPVPHPKDMPQADDRSNLVNLVTALAWPYLVGAYWQLERYAEMAKLLPNDMQATVACLHETSNLFEDLDTIDRYTQMCGATHPLHPRILNIRNHIRHDIRDNLDQDGLKRRRSRARKLGLDDGEYVAFFAFNESGIMAGNVIVRIAEIEEFLEWAKDVFMEIIQGVLGDSEESVQMPPLRRPSL